MLFSSWLAVKLTERGMAPFQVAVYESILVESIHLRRLLC
jgi:hypothetical protein